jgi:anti-anti-sigma factor
VLRERAHSIWKPAPDGSILLSGEVDMATVKQLEETIAEVMRPGRPVVIDMAALTYIDSSGLSLLVWTHQQSGERVVICNPSRQVRRVLEIMDGRPKPGAWVIQTD